MAAREHFLGRLLELPRIQDPEVRRGVFRQSVTALGQGDAAAGPLALAGVDPAALARSIQTVWADGLLDDLDFIDPSAAAVALYQIAGALPLGAERRQVGRKVLHYQFEGNADTFAALASRMAMGSIKPLQGAGVRARVALCMSLRGGADGSVDRLALALVTRRELAREWILQPATGSLPDRRLAARILERACREAAQRAGTGDPYPLRVFQAVHNPARYLTPPRPDSPGHIGPAWESLLADREGLVWRHVAVARGLLCGVIPELVDLLRGHLRADLSPTEWRRAATSLVARVAVDRESGLRDAMRLLEGPLLKRDAGIAMAMVWGLAPVAEVEPEAADVLVQALAHHSPIIIADALVELRRTLPTFAGQALETCATALRASLLQSEDDDGLTALGSAILAELEGDGGHHAVGRALDAAVEAFGEHGTRRAFELAREALSAATAAVGELEALDVGHGQDDEATAARTRGIVVLRDLDTYLLESRTLNDLLLLGRPPGVGATGVEAVDDLDARLAHWLLDPRRRPEGNENLERHITLHQRQLRALLHLIDGSSTDFGDDNDRRMRVRARWTTAARKFVAYLTDQPKNRLTRAVIATVARAFDALVRDSAAEPVDVFLYAASHLSSPDHMQVVAEASMHPDVMQLVSAYIGFVRNASSPTGDTPRARLDAFKRFLETFPSQRTSRSEAFRVTAWALVRALESVLAASSLGALVPQEAAGTTSSPLAVVEDAIGQIHQLVIGAERRCSDQVVRAALVLDRRHALATAADNAVTTRSGDELMLAMTAVIQMAERHLPSPIAQLITTVVPRLSGLQAGTPSLMPSTLEAQAPLPDWIPPRRILGGFYVLRQLGGGNVGSVFVVKRAEDRHEAEAERFALKVPEYNTTVARTMSEGEFLKLFREEAGALLSIPEHPNIARFVTFDVGARPKPILVMELVEGVSCERIISSQALDMTRALNVLDGILAGLEAMHGASIAHLDVKPSNTILRETTADPVLVDFGLAGRHIRPGCATLCYGAPEIWETPPGSMVNGQAWAADVYAFGCVAYEVLTGLTLFEGNSDVAIISAHITHDGLPPQVHRLSQNPTLQPFAMFLYQCLRNNPNHRANATQLRRELTKLRPALARRPWPLTPE